MKEEGIQFVIYRGVLSIFDNCQTEKEAIESFCKKYHGGLCLNYNCELVRIIKDKHDTDYYDCIRGYIKSGLIQFFIGKDRDYINPMKFRTDVIESGYLEEISKFYFSKFNEEFEVDNSLLRLPEVFLH